MPFSVYIFLVSHEKVIQSLKWHESESFFSLKWKTEHVIGLNVFRHKNAWFLTPCTTFYTLLTTIIMQLNYQRCSTSVLWSWIHKMLHSKIAWHFLPLRVYTEQSFQREWFLHKSRREDNHDYNRLCSPQATREWCNVEIYGPWNGSINSPAVYKG